MSRIRTVKPELFKHEDLFDAELESRLPLRLAFIGLLTVADCEGRFKWRPRTLKLDVLPHDLIDFASILNALESRGFIQRYEVDGEVYGLIPTFKKHQRLQTKEVAAGSSLPAPRFMGEPGTLPVRTQERTDTHLESQEGKGMEEEGKRKGKEEAAQAPRASPPVPPVIVSPSTEDTPTATKASKPVKVIKAPITADWTPAETTYALLEKQGIHRGFADKCLDEFRLYWTEQQEQRPGWESTFVNNVKRQWERRPTTTPIPTHHNGKPRPFLSKQDRIAAQSEAALAEWMASQAQIQINVIEGECHEIH